MDKLFTILGGTGFVGSRLKARLESAGAVCFAPAKGSQEVFSRPLGRVIFCAGYTADFRKHPLETAEAHVGLLVDILSKATFDSLLYLSSTRVYEGASGTRESVDLVVNPANPNHIFNLTKLAGEACCLSQSRNEVRVVRLSNVIGDDFESDNFLYSVMRDLILNKFVTLRTSPDSAKDYVALPDVLELLPLIAERGKARIYNLASGRNFDNATILSRLCDLSGGKASFVPGAERIAFPEIEINRLRSEFGFSPRPVLEELEKVFSAFEAHLAGK